MIVFLPPNFSLNDDSSGIVYISRVHKEPGLLVYSIDFSRPSVPNDWSRLEACYQQLLLTPLHQITSQAPSRRFHVFGVVWSVEANVPANAPFASLQLFDFISTQRTVLRLGRRLAGWCRALKPGFCVQVRDVCCPAPGHLHSTASTQVFLLATPGHPPPSPSRLSARAAHLSAPEREILHFLAGRALACPIPPATIDLTAFQPLALTRRIGGGWELLGESGCPVRFSVLDAQTWIKLLDLVQCRFLATLHFYQLTASAEFTGASRLSLTPCPGRSFSCWPGLRSMARCPWTVFNGVIQVKGRLELHLLSDNNTLNASLSTSQPERLRLIPVDGGEALGLDDFGFEWRREWAEVAEHLLMVRTVTEDEDTIVRKSFELL